MSQRTSTTASSQSRETVNDFTTKIAEIAHNNPGLVDANPIIRFRGLPASGSAIFESEVTYNDDEDIFLAGVVTLPSDSGQFLNERLMLKSPYKTKDAINETTQFDAVPRFDGGRWHFEADTAETCIRHFLRQGHDVAGHLQLFIDLIDIPEQPSSNKEETIVVPGLGETPSPQACRERKAELTDTEIPDHTNSGGGGETPFVKTGTCPVNGCPYHSGNFKSLRGHIGGKVAAGDEAHKELAVRIDDYR